MKEFHSPGPNVAGFDKPYTSEEYVYYLNKRANVSFTRDHVRIFLCNKPSQLIKYSRKASGEV